MVRVRVCRTFGRVTVFPSRYTSPLTYSMAQLWTIARPAALFPDETQWFKIASTRPVREKSPTQPLPSHPVVGVGNMARSNEWVRV